MRSVIDLSHRLGCLVTAEGVEVQDVADWLVSAGCDQGQGYLWQRPALWTELDRSTDDLLVPSATTPKGLL